MASNEPQNLSEWQLHCVLKRANLLQYYESFIKHGECDVLQLSKAEDGKFKDVMEKVGIAQKSIHVRHFKSTLLQWAKDPGKNKHVPSYIKKYDDPTTSPAQGSLKPGTVSFSMTGKSADVPKLKKIIQDIKTKEKEELTSYKSEKKKTHPKEDTTQKYTQSVIKDQEHHEHHDPTGYYDELLDNTVLDKMVLDNLISRCILMIEDREEIVKPTTQRERNKVLLDILTERPYPTFHLFKDVLLESEPSNSCVQELVKKMMSTESRDAHISWQGHEIDCLLQKEAGPCISGITRYYYDIKTINCRPFVYGGCQGNANNYLTREQCQEKCKLQLAADEKPGECPVVNRAAIICPRQERRSHTCSGDGSCPTVLKCCDNGCFSNCIIPVPVEKPGYCPYFNLAATTCLFTSKQPLRFICSNDAHCPGKQKCCQSCSMTCRDPGNPCPREPRCRSSPVGPGGCEPKCVFEYDTFENGARCKIRCNRVFGPKPGKGQPCPPTNCPLIGPVEPRRRPIGPPAPAPSPPPSQCPPVCAIFCQFGNVLDENNCPTCECKTEPKVCARCCGPPPCCSFCIDCEIGNPLPNHYCGSSDRVCPKGYYCKTNPQIGRLGVCCKGTRPQKCPADHFKQRNCYGKSIRLCKSDDNCAPNKKCCKQGCFHYCIDPVLYEWYMW